MTSSNTTAHIGDDAWQAREARRKHRQWLWQSLIILMVIGILFLFAVNVSNNLDARNIRSGFEFLKDRASFEIGESIISISSNDTFARMFLAGMLNTVKVSCVAIVTATILGTIVGLMRLSNHPLIRFLGVAHVEFYRNIPLLIQLFAVYLILTEFLPDSFSPFTCGDWLMVSKAGIQFAVPQLLALSMGLSVAIALVIGFLVRGYWIKRATTLTANACSIVVSVLTACFSLVLCGVFFGWDKPMLDGFMIVGGGSLTPEFLALWIGLTTFTSASIAEIVRAGVLAVPKQQWQAAEALGMTRFQAINYVILPQSLRLAIPPMASQYMNLIKNSSLAVIIGYPDIVNVGNTSIVIMGQALEAILIIMSVYLLLNLLIALVMNKVNAQVMTAPNN